MKIIGRILIILAAALLVVGATYGIVRATGGTSLGLRDGGRGQFVGGNPPAGGFLGGNNPRGDFGGDGGRRGGLFGAFDVLRNVFVVGVIFLIIMSASIVYDALRKRPGGDPLAESD